MFICCLFHHLSCCCCFSYPFRLHMKYLHKYFIKWHCVRLCWISVYMVICTVAGLEGLCWRFVIRIYFILFIDLFFWQLRKNWKTNWQVLSRKEFHSHTRKSSFRWNAKRKLQHSWILSSPARHHCYLTRVKTCLSCVHVSYSSARDIDHLSSRQAHV